MTVEALRARLEQFGLFGLNGVIRATPSYYIGLLGFSYRVSHVELLGLFTFDYTRRSEKP